MSAMLASLFCYAENTAYRNRTRSVLGLVQYDLDFCSNLFGPNANVNEMEEGQPCRLQQVDSCTAVGFAGMLDRRNRPLAGMPMQGWRSLEWPLYPHYLSKK